LLDETIITQALVDKFKLINNFKTSTALETYLKTTRQGLLTADKKLDANFAKMLKADDAELTDLGKLFKKKEPKDIITLIET
jgi:hypothetical protein